MKAAIIGGGLGGLATALRLKARGWDVAVFEANISFGGKMNRWRKGEYCFDTGPSLVTMPSVFSDLYDAVGENMEEHLALVRMDPHADYRFPDGSRICCPADTGKWRAVIRDIEARDAKGFDELHALGRKIYELSKRTFFRRSPRSRPELADLAALKYLPIWHGWGNYANTVAHYLRNPHLRQIYNRYPTYVGSSPYLCPATLLVIPFLEREFGAWYVRGGLYTVVDSLVALAVQRGVELHCGSRVIAIETQGRRASGIRLADGIRVPADVVIMNGDVEATPALLGRSPRAKPETRSLSGLVLMLGIPRRPAGLAHHTVLFSSDYRTEFEDLFSRKRFPLDPTVYISAPGATDDSVAAPGGDALFVMANAPPDDGQWTSQRIAAVSRILFEKLTLAGIDTGKVEARHVLHPGRFSQQYLAPGGAIYGTHSHGWKHAFFRPPNRSTEFQGLYFVGGSTHPGGGTPTVLLSAKITAGIIESDARA